LALEWLHAPVVAGQAPPPSNASVLDPAFVVPAPDRLRALDEMISLGYCRGVLTLLDVIEAESPACVSFVAHMRELASHFQLDAMTGVLRKARDAPITE
jgi:hypothetical protein